MCSTLKSAVQIDEVNEFFECFRLLQAQVLRDHLRRAPAADMTDVAHDQSYQFSAKPRPAPGSGPYRENQTINIQSDPEMLTNDSSPAEMIN